MINTFLSVEGEKHGYGECTGKFIYLFIFEGEKHRFMHRKNKNRKFMHKNTGLCICLCLRGEDTATVYA